MNIIINEKNKARISAAIEAAEGKATARTIDYDDIVSELSWLESFWGIPKKAMTGIKVSVNANAQTFPSAYKYTPESTWFDAEKTSSGWKLTDVYRDVCRGPKSQYQVKLTDTAKLAIMDANEHPCR